MIIINNEAQDKKFLGIPLESELQVQVDDWKIINRLAWHAPFTDEIIAETVTINNGSNLSPEQAIRFIRGLDKEFASRAITITCSGNEITQTTDTLETSFIFPGSNLIGVPTGIWLYARVSGFPHSGYVRIWNKSAGFSGELIAEKEISGLSMYPPVPISMGTLTNIPATKSIFEVKGRIDPGASWLKIFCVSILFG